MTPPAVAQAATPAFELASVAPRAARTVRVFDQASWRRLRGIVDALVVSVSAAAAVLGLHFSSGARLLGIAFPLLMIGLLVARRSPDDLLSGSTVDTLVHLAATASVCAMATVAVGYVLDVQHILPMVFRLWVYTVVYLAVTRAVLRSLRLHAVSSRAFATPTLIVGAGVVGDHLARRLLDSAEYGLRPVGLIDASPMPREDSPVRGQVPVLGGPSELLDAVADTGARRLIVAFSANPDAELVAGLETCRTMGIEVSLVPRLFELINDRSELDHLGGLPLVTVRPTNPRSWQFTIKHAIDRVLAGAALILFAPLLLIIALLVRRSSPGPVLFRQRRVGRDGREFDLLKFRTMSELDLTSIEFDLPPGLAPGGVEGDDRRTWIGRILRATSLDELPQLLNVLRGEMSLVGPRPERPEYVSRFSAEVDRYNSRHRVKSGITGWAQVCGLRGQTSIADRVEWDNFYIQNWSLGLDLRIIAMTVTEVFRFRG